MSLSLGNWFGCGHCKSMFTTAFSVCPECGASWEKDGETISPKVPSEDNVNHPSHYTAYNGLEIIDLTEQMNFNKGNAVKYICRAGLKDPSKEIEDLEKAAWYLRREIDRIKKRSTQSLPYVAVLCDKCSRHRCQGTRENVKYDENCDCCKMAHLWAG